MFLTQFINSWLFRISGVRLTKNGFFGDEISNIDLEAWKIILKVRDRTMTSENSIYNLILATRYIHQNAIKGDLVECGVWRGGSMMAVAEALMGQGATERNLYLYDTFEGMTVPTDVDITLSGDSASDLLSKYKLSPDDSHLGGVIAFATLKDVQSGMNQTKYESANIFYIQGDVSETLLTVRHSQISLLRLDTDWYESTLKELNVLWPLLTVGGILILDDYDYWGGARTAVDEFFSSFLSKPFMAKLAGGGRLIVKLHG